MKPLVLRHLRVVAALALLLITTTAAAFVPLGMINWMVSLLFGFAMAGLIMLFFMQLRKSSPLIWLTSGAGFLWLSILLVLVLMDYLSRPWPR
jgi:caa(3)-type oxidase subunit IV